MVHPAIKVNDLIPFLEKSMNAKILDCSAKFLTGKGENFGSTMFGVRVKVQNYNSSGSGTDLCEPIMIELAVKAPVTDCVFALLFQPKESCIKENCFYTEIIPSLLQLQREHNIAENDLIDVFIRCYGARSSQNPDSKIADGHSLLVLENIKVKGYQTGNCAAGFNRYDSLKIIEKMAKFHALPIALRMLSPKVFEQKVKPYLKPIDLYVNFDSTYDIYKSVCASVDRITNLDKDLREKVRHQLKVCNDWRKDTSLQADTPYTTIAHRDLWNNNIMFTRDREGNLAKIKFCDYQLTGYFSFAVDLIFFIFSSITVDEVEENFELFIQHHHKHFCETLQQLGCPLDDYTYEKYCDEIKDKAKLELEHIVLMLKVIMADKSKVAHLTELTFDFVLKDDHLDDRFYNRLHTVLNRFEKLGFL